MQAKRGKLAIAGKQAGPVPSEAKYPDPYFQLELKAIVDRDLTFRATIDLSNHRPSGPPRRPFWLPGRSSFVVVRRNKSWRCRVTSPRGYRNPSWPATSPRAAPRGAFFASGLGPPLFVSKRGIKARAAESSRRVPHQRDPQTRRRNDAMAWSTPEVREVCVGMEVTSYLSAEM